MKAAKRPPILKSSIAALVTLLACSALPAKGQQILTWTGASSNLWEDNGNWNPNSTPAGSPGSILIFTGSNHTNPSDNNNAFGGTLVQSIIFDQNASAFTLFDQPVFMLGGSAIINNSRFLQTLSFSDVFSPFGGISLLDINGVDADDFGGEGRRS